MYFAIVLTPRERPSKFATRSSLNRELRFDDKRRLTVRDSAGKKDAFTSDGLRDQTLEGFRRRLLRVVFTRLPERPANGLGESGVEGYFRLPSESRIGARHVGLHFPLIA